jgi:hypothetical protein
LNMESRTVSDFKLLKKAPDEGSGVVTILRPGDLVEFEALVLRHVCACMHVRMHLHL